MAKIELQELAMIFFKIDAISEWLRVPSKCVMYMPPIKHVEECLCTTSRGQFLCREHRNA